jgi:hypothetical protein
MNKTTDQEIIRAEDVGIDPNDADELIRWLLSGSGTPKHHLTVTYTPNTPERPVTPLSEWHVAIYPDVEPDFAPLDADREDDEPIISASGGSLSHALHTLMERMQRAGFSLPA